MELLRNSVQLIGNLGADPELKTFASGSRVAEVNLAISQGKNKKTDEWNPSTWIPIKAWGAAADELMKFRKGDRIAITEAKLSHDEWVSKSDGSKQTRINLTVFKLEAAPRASETSTSASVQEPSGTLSEVPKKLLDAIEASESLEVLTAIKQKATKQGIPFESYEPAWQAKVSEIASLDDIPF